ncbi:uncharacterized protein BXZ73DRAFT_106143 [Epithele typhae]|uniref:uncharacterized protein n=1 Tax=Epithele typhae TaxID=378194 RepID=UPI0020084AED|nr:uncharacterized protein BXZ73DRAFT_106143 [Epithele typhae]KAH9915592.1 hypothetical protein BXZ73DRAFT_106143 [Epithele typhae]
MPLPPPDNLPPSPARDEIRQRISEIEAGAVDGLTSALEDERRALYTKWNSTLPIQTRLPIELLLRVFAACFQPARPVDDDPKRTHRRRKVLLLVCRAWRDLIESAPDLWTFITTHMPRRLYELVLSRCKHATLDISFDRESEWLFGGVPLSPDLAPLILPEEDVPEKGDDEDEESQTGDDEFVDEWIVPDDEGKSSWSEAAGIAIVAHSHRIRTLSLSDDGARHPRKYSMSFLQALFCDRAWPALEALCVEDAGAVKGILCVTSNFFPNLQHLQLEGVMFPIEPTMFPRFRSLDLSGARTRWLPLEDLLICLSSAHYLEELSLAVDGPIISNSHEVAHPPQLRLPLELPHLSSLGIGSNSNDEMVLLLRAFPLIRSPTALDFLYISNDDWRQPPPNTNSGRGLSIVDAFFPTRAPDTTPIPIPPSVRNLYIYLPMEITGFSTTDRYSGKPEKVRLFTWRAEPFDDHVDEEGPQNLYGLSNAIDDVLILFRHIPLTQLTFIAHGPLHPADNRWDELFRAFPALEYLYVVGDGTPIAILHALTPSPLDDSPAPCTALESLTYMINKPNVEDTKATFEATIECLRARAARGMHPLRELEINVDLPRTREEREPPVDVEPYLAQLREMVSGEFEFLDSLFTVVLTATDHSPFSRPSTTVPPHTPTWKPASSTVISAADPPLSSSLSLYIKPTMNRSQPQQSSSRILKRKRDDSLEPSGSSGDAQTTIDILHNDDDPPSDADTEIIEPEKSNEECIAAAVEAGVKVRDYAYQRPKNPVAPAPEIWWSPLSTLIAYDRYLRLSAGYCLPEMVPTGKVLYHLRAAGWISAAEADWNWSKADKERVAAYADRPQGPYSVVIPAHIKRPTRAYRAALLRAIHHPSQDDVPEKQIYIPEDEPDMDDGPPRVSAFQFARLSLVPRAALDVGPSAPSTAQIRPAYRTHKRRRISGPILSMPILPSTRDGTTTAPAELQVAFASSSSPDGGSLGRSASLSSMRSDTPPVEDLPAPAPAPVRRTLGRTKTLASISVR